MLKLLGAMLAMALALGTVTPVSAQDEDEEESAEAADDDDEAEEDALDEEQDEAQDEEQDEPDEDRPPPDFGASSAEGGNIVPGLVVASLGVGAVLFAGVFALMASGAYSDAESETVHAETVKLRDDGDAHAARGNVLLVVGASLVTIGLAWAAVEAGAPEGPDADTPSAELSIGPGSVLVRGAF